MPGMVGGGHLGAQLAARLIRHGDSVMIGRHRLVGMTEAQAAIIGARLERAHFRHQRHIAIVAHPYRRLVRADKARDPLILISIGGDADPVLAGLGRPVGHSKGGGDDRHGAAIVRPDHRAAGADIRVHPIDRIGRRGSGGHRACGGGHEQVPRNRSQPCHSPSSAARPLSCNLATLAGRATIKYYKYEQGAECGPPAA